MTRDLTTGKPIKAILSFSIPVLLGNLFQQFYNMTDSAIVGQFVGVEALAGVGATGSINFLILGFVVGLCTGFSVPIAQSFGAGDYEGLKRYFTSAIWLTAGFSLVLTVLTLVFLDPILMLMQTPEDIYDYARTYIGTIFSGIGGIFLYNLLASVMRALGDSKTPVFFLLFASVLNVVLDLIFVLPFGMGVFGTSLATVISQSVSGILCILLIIKKFTILRADREEWKPNLQRMKKLCGVGIPMGLQFSITAIGSICIQSAINTLGSIYVAAITASMRIHSIATQGFETLGLAMATYTGQNLGAEKPDRIRKGVRQSLLIGTIYAAFAFLVLFLFGKTFALVFVSPEETELIENIFFSLMANCGFYILLNILLILRNTIQGAGFSSFAMFSGGFEMVARCLVAFGLVGIFGFTGACFANACAWGAANIFLIPAYLFVMKKIEKRLEEKKAERSSQPV